MKGTGYPLHSPVSPSLSPRASPCAITFQLESTTSLGSARDSLNCSWDCAYVNELQQNAMKNITLKLRAPNTTHTHHNWAAEFQNRGRPCLPVSTLHIRILRNSFITSRNGRYCLASMGTVPHGSQSSLLYKGYRVPSAGVTQQRCDIVIPPPLAPRVKNRYSPSGPLDAVLRRTLSLPLP